MDYRGALRVLIIGGVALSGLQCSSSSSGKAALAAGCLANSDCDAPLVCAFKVCHNACKETRDCEGAALCVKIEGGNVCRLPTESACTESTNCPAPLKCGVDGQCRPACVDASTDCLSGQVCASHVCAESSSIDLKTGDLPHTNPKGGWNGTTDGPVEGADAGSGGTTGAGGNGGTAAGGAGGNGGTAAGGAGGRTTGSGGAGGAGGSGAGGTEAGDAGDAAVACQPGFATCATGGVCGTRIDLTTQCGGCGIICDTSHNTATCTNQVCVPTCNTGYLDCDGKPYTGCETDSATNAANCGACDRVCSQTTCADSQCVAVALNANGDGYRTAFGGGFLFIDRVNAQPPSAYDIRRVATDGSGEVGFGADSKAPGAMAVVGTDLYYSFLPLSVFKKPLTAVAADVGTPVFTPAELPMYMAAKGNALYWISNTGVIYTRAIGAAASDPGSAIVTSGVSYVSSFFVNDDAFYWLTQDGKLRTAPLGGGTAAVVTAANTKQGAPVAADGTYVYFVADVGLGTEGIYRYKTGGTAEQLVYKGGVSFLLVDDTSVYFAAYPFANHEIDKAPKDKPSNGTKIATQSGFGPLVAYDSKFIYTVGAGSGEKAYRFVK
jgi:hypothetical protein